MEDEYYWKDDEDIFIPNIGDKQQKGSYYKSLFK